MAAELIFFGKPQSFEVLSFNQAQQYKAYKESERALIDPKFFLPTKNDGNIIHYIRGEKNYLLLYTYAQPFSGTRQGITIGVGFSSEQEILLSNNNLTYLSDLLISFQENACDNHRFKDIHLENVAKQTYKNNSQLLGYVDLGSSKGVSINKAQLFYLPHLVQQFSDTALSKCLADDIYITDKENLFEHLLNKKVFGKLNNQLYTIKNGAIVPYVKPSPIPEPKPPIGGGEKPDDTHKKIKTLELENEYLNENLKNSNEKNIILKKALKKAKNITKLVGATALFFMVLSTAFFFKDSWMGTTTYDEIAEQDNADSTQVEGKKEGDVKRVPGDDNSVVSSDNYDNNIKKLSDKYNNISQIDSKENLEERKEILIEIINLQEKNNKDVTNAKNTLKKVKHALNNFDNQRNPIIDILDSEQSNLRNNSKDEEIWGRAIVQNEIAGYNYYLRLFPKGKHIEAANKKIEELKKKKVEASSNALLKPTTVGENEGGDSNVGEEHKQTNDGGADKEEVSSGITIY